MEDVRTGVFVCECGGNIANTVNVKAVCATAAEWESVSVSKYHTYVCSKPGLDMTKGAIQKFGLNRIVVAACSPRMHQKTFESTLGEVGLNRFLLQRVNIREQCSWAHAEEPEKATKKAINMVRGSVERARYLEPLEPYRFEVEPRVLVVGGGIAGITASLDLANQGYEVYLVEKKPSIGGHMAQFSKVFPTMDCAQCILSPKIVEIGRNSNIKLLTCSEVVEVSGAPGRYHIKILEHPRGVDAELCVACGACSKACPVEVATEFDVGMGRRKAAYLMFPQAVPRSYTIDFEHCTRCGSCLNVCARKAIDLNDKEKIIELDVGALIVATGYEYFDVEKLGEYGYGRHPDIITALHLERMLSPFGPTGGMIRRLSDGGKVEKIAYVLCVGSRDPHRGVPYCSQVCCMYSMKQSQILLDAMPEIRITIFYIDIRSAGRGYEEFYEQARSKGARFIRGRVAEVFKRRSCDRLTLRAADATMDTLIEEDFDLVVLCPAIIASPGTEELMRKLGVALGEDAFVLEKHPKLDPVRTQREAVYAAGCVLGPKDIRYTVSEASAAAACASTFIGMGTVEVSPDKVVVHENLCDGCKECVAVCPFKAIEFERGKASVNPILCYGCGACVPTCEEGALELKNNTDAQLLASIRGSLWGRGEGTTILAFFDYDVAYAAADLIGLSHIDYPANIMIIRVPSTALLSSKHILYAFASGADGVFLCDAHSGAGPMAEAAKLTEERIERFNEVLDELNIESFRLWFNRIYVPDFKKLATIFQSFSKSIDEMGSLEEADRERLVDRLKTEYPMLIIPAT